MFTSVRGLRDGRGAAAAVLIGLSALLAAGLVAHAAEQTPQWHVVQGSDGTLYLVSDTGRYTLQVEPIADEDLAALPDAGPIGPFVGAPPAPASAETVRPSDTSGEQSLGPAPERSPVPLPESVSVPEVPEPSSVPSLAEPPGVPSVPSVPSAPGRVPPAAGEPPSSSVPATPPALGPAPSGPPVAPAAGGGQPGLGQTAPPRAVVPPPLATSLPAAPQSLGPVPPIAAPTPTPTPTVATAVEAPVLISGSGSQTTRSFTLRGGTYNALWTATTPTSTPDTFAAILRPSDSGNLHTQVIGTALLPGSRSISGQTQLTSLPAGTYSVDIVGGTNWSLSISVQSGPGVGRP